MYKLGQYLNPETNRYQWAVLCTENNVWYFASKYGKKAAERLQMQLMVGAGLI